MLGRDVEGWIQEKNFALKSSGASIVRSSKPFHSGARLCSLGFCWNYSRSPDIILERGLLPGNCWAMDGAQGYIVIKLSEAIIPRAVTLDHIPQIASPYETIPSAPKHFSIYGLKDAFEQEEGVLLGSFNYKKNSFPEQMFQLKRTKANPFPYLMVKIYSNHGHPNYTCIYGVRVHGQQLNRISYSGQEDIDNTFQLIQAMFLEWFIAT
ncbi:SUN domain-containing protein 3-like [Paroedura picta]|uniref:SUN domain-containing protein 3-like n=1 Tax=Paroedura picta TaxID=143630 RepID=UPI004056CDA5